MLITIDDQYPACFLPDNVRNDFLVPHIRSDYSQRSFIQKFADEYDFTEEKGDSFYPMLKSKVNIQGAVWCMKKEWIFSYSFDIFCR